MAQTLSNQAHVTFSYEGADASITNDSNIVNSTVKDKYDFSVEKTATSETFRPGDTVTFFVRIANTGCTCLGGFNISDNLGGEGYLTYVSGSARLFANGEMISVTPTSTQPLNVELSTELAKNAEIIFQYTVEVSDEISAEVTEIVNEVSVDAETHGCCCNNDSSGSYIRRTATHTLTKDEFAEVLITKSVSNDNVCCDEELDYIITLTNVGTIDALDVVVTDTLPENFTLTEVHMDNNGDHYQFAPSEYTIDSSNVLTLPNATGRIILVQALAPGVENTTRIRLHGHM